MDHDTHENDCPMCGGQLKVLGQLGDRIHYRCGKCGYKCSWKVGDKPAHTARSGTVH